jgi:hypothetical protein
MIYAEKLFESEYFKDRQDEAGHAQFDSACDKFNDD